MYNFQQSPEPLESESDPPADEQAVKLVQELSTCVKEIPIYECENEAKYHFNSITFLDNIRNELSECNTQFLSDYLKVLSSNNKMTISCVTEKVSPFIIIRKIKYFFLFKVRNDIVMSGATNIAKINFRPNFIPTKKLIRNKC